MKTLFIVLLGVLVFSTSLQANTDAEVYQGQKVYMIKLKGSFKLDLQDFTTEHTAKEWVQLFANDAKGFIELYSERYPRASRYLHSKRFQKKAPSLLVFVKTYAKNSGKTPGCTCIIG